MSDILHLSIVAALWRTSVKAIRRMEMATPDFPVLAPNLATSGKQQTEPTNHKSQ
jgi:hypothetical protein